MMFLVACALASLALVSGAIEKDKVTTLPGYTGNLPSTHYSGCKFAYLELFFRHFFKLHLR